MTEVIITAIVGIITTFFSSLITYRLSKRKTLAEDRAAELDNAVNAVKYYRELLDDMAVRLTSANNTINSMQIQNRELMAANEKLDAQHRELMSTNQFLVDKLQKYKQLSEKTQ